VTESRHFTGSEADIDHVICYNNRMRIWHVVSKSEF